MEYFDFDVIGTPEKENPFLSAFSFHSRP